MTPETPLKDHPYWLRVCRFLDVIPDYWDLLPKNPTHWRIGTLGNLQEPRITYRGCLLGHVLRAIYEDPSHTEEDFAKLPKHSIGPSFDGICNLYGKDSVVAAIQEYITERQDTSLEGDQDDPTSCL